jgi:hypothetical protein
MCYFKLYFQVFIQTSLHALTHHEIPSKHGFTMPSRVEEKLGQGRPHLLPRFGAKGEMHLTHIFFFFVGAHIHKFPAGFSPSPTMHVKIHSCVLAC